jgi:hypothetical protein
MRCPTRMRNTRHPVLASRIGLTLALVALVVVSTAEVAFAKVLPVASIHVATPNPTSGSPIRILVRFGENFDLPDAPWENFEVSVVSADRTDSGGWPLDRDYRGTLVPLRRTSKGVYGGSIVVDRSGDFVVFAWSSVYAREMIGQGVVMKFRYASPLRLLVRRTVPTKHAEVQTLARPRPSTGLLALAGWASLLTTCACIALVTTRARRRTRRERAAATRWQ